MTNKKEKMKIQPVALLNGAGRGGGGWASGRFVKFLEKL